MGRLVRRGSTLGRVRFESRESARVRARRAGIWAAVLGFGWFLLISALHDIHGGAGAMDLGYYLQAIHAIAFGNLNPSPAILPQHTYFADNLALYLYPMALVFRVWPSVWLLLGAQAVWLGAGVGIAVHEAARARVRGAALALFALALLLLPAALGVAWYDFHFDALGGLLGVLTALSLDRGRIRTAWLLAILALLVKEDAGLLLVAAGLWHLCGKNGSSASRRHAAGIAVAGAVAVVLGAVVMARLSPHHAATMARELFFSGPGLWRELHAALRGLFWPRKGFYLLQLVLPLGLLPLLAPRRLPAILAAVAVNLLVLDPSFYSGAYQYNGFVLPFLGVAAAEGLAVLRTAGWRLLGPVLAVLGTLLGQWVYGLPITMIAATWATPSVPAGLSALVPARDARGVLTTNGLAAYIDPNWAASIIPLGESGDYLGHAGDFTRYPTIVLLRTGQGSPIWQLTEVLGQAGYTAVASDGAAVVLHRTGGPESIRTDSTGASHVLPAWRPAVQGVAAALRVPPGIYRIAVPVRGSGLAQLCVGAGFADRVCGFFQPAWTGRPLQVVTYTGSGRLRLHLDIEPDTGPVEVTGTTLTALRYTVRP